jgi:hypothetical protein
MIDTVRAIYQFTAARLADSPYPAEGGWLTAAQARNIGALADYSWRLFEEGEQGGHVILAHLAALWRGHPGYDRRWEQWLQPAQ